MVSHGRRLTSAEDGLKLSLQTRDVGHEVLVFRTVHALLGHVGDGGSKDVAVVHPVGEDQRCHHEVRQRQTRSADEFIAGQLSESIVVLGDDCLHAGLELFAVFGSVAGRTPRAGNSEDTPLLVDEVEIGVDFPQLLGLP